MCGRAACSLDPAQILQLFKVQQWQDKEKYAPSYNVAPGRYQPVLICDADGRLLLVSMKWGLLPSWTHDPKASGPRPINAKCETLMEKPMFKQLIKGKRCVIIIEGFFEWKKDGSTKQPYFIKPLKNESSSGDDDEKKSSDRTVITMAGLYDVWKNKQTGEIVYTHTVITTAAPPSMGWLHDRMPAILTEDQVNIWLTSPSVPEALALLQPHIGPLEIYPVSNAVGSTSHDSSDNIKKVEVKPKPDIRAFFAPKQESNAQMKRALPADGHLDPDQSPLKKLKLDPTLHRNPVSPVKVKQVPTRDPSSLRNKLKLDPSKVKAPSIKVKQEPKKE